MEMELPTPDAMVGFVKPPVSVTAAPFVAVFVLLASVTLYVPTAKPPANAVLMDWLADAPTAAMLIDDRSPLLMLALVIVPVTFTAPAVLLAFKVTSL